MIYAVGDIHGHLAKLDRAIQLIERDGGENAQIVFVGDYVDRGPDSKGVLERLSKGVAQGRPWVTLRGNHDLIFRRFITDGTLHDPSRPTMISYLNPRIGGQMTLLSYLSGQPIANKLLLDEEITDPVLIAELSEAAKLSVPTTHVEFLNGLSNMHILDDFIFVHAGLRPGVKLENQRSEDLLWIRNDWLKSTEDFGRLIVHGHTPRSRPRLYSNRLNVDGGAPFGRDLVPVRLESDAAFMLTDTGPKQLPVDPDSDR